MKNKNSWDFTDNNTQKWLLSFSTAPYNQRKKLLADFKNTWDNKKYVKLAKMTPLLLYNTTIHRIIYRPT